MGIVSSARAYKTMRRRRAAQFTQHGQLGLDVREARAHGQVQAFTRFTAPGMGFAEAARRSDLVAAARHRAPAHILLTRQHQQEDSR